MSCVQVYRVAIEYVRMKYILGIVALGVLSSVFFWYTQKDVQMEAIKAPTSIVENNGTNTPLPSTENGTPTSGNSSTSSPVNTAPRLTMAEVAKHATVTSCYSAINGNVYDLTVWIGKHPGGARAIKGICGIDGSDGFNGKHGGQPQPASTIAKYLLGPLVQ